MNEISSIVNVVLKSWAACTVFYNRGKTCMVLWTHIKPNRQTQLDIQMLQQLEKYHKCFHKKLLYVSQRKFKISSNLQLLKLPSFYDSHLYIYTVCLLHILYHSKVLSLHIFLSPFLCHMCLLSIKKCQKGFTNHWLQIVVWKTIDRGSCKIKQT